VFLLVAARQRCVEGLDCMTASTKVSSDKEQSGGNYGFFFWFGSRSLETTSVKRTASPHWRQLGKVSLAFRLAS
jgi:hypothetical protein